MGNQRPPYAGKQGVCLRCNENKDETVLYNSIDLYKGKEVEVIICKECDSYILAAIMQAIIVGDSVIIHGRRR